MPNPLLSQIVLPVDVEGTMTNVTFDLKDAGARQMIEDLGDALYWLGVTTTELEDGTTSAVVSIGGVDKTATVGAMVSYDGLEFVYNGATWQAMGHANFGALAFADTASASYTPAGTVSVTPSQANDTTTSVTPFGSAGTVPSWSVSGEVATFNAGTAATAGTAVDVVTASGAVTITSASFSGTAASIQVSPDVVTP